MVQWTKFWTLGFIWGSSFLLIKIAVDELGALPLVSLRLGGAAILFFIFLRITGRHLPTVPSQLFALTFVGIFNTAVPFVLISWGETEIDSGLATVLNSTTPLFGLVFAHYVLADERLTRGKIAGLVIGFLGIVLLTSQSLGEATDNPLPGQLAVLVASGSYAMCVVTIRRFLRQVETFTVAGYSTIVGATVTVVVTLLAVDPLPALSGLSSDVLASIVTLAIVNTFVAYFLFYDLIANWGARATLVTYAMPPIGVTLGYLVLDERVGWRLVVGGAMIIAGIVLAKRAALPPAQSGNS